MDNIEARVESLVRDQLALSDDAELNMGDHLVNEHGMDSLDQIELIMNIENEFGFTISDDEIDDLTTMQKIVDLVYQNEQ